MYTQEDSYNKGLNLHLHLTRIGFRIKMFSDKVCFYKTLTKHINTKTPKPNHWPAIYCYIFSHIFFLPSRHDTATVTSDKQALTLTLFCNMQIHNIAFQPVTFSLKHFCPVTLIVSHDCIQSCVSYSEIFKTNYCAGQNINPLPLNKAHKVYIYIYECSMMFFVYCQW